MVSENERETCVWGGVNNFLGGICIELKAEGANQFSVHGTQKSVHCSQKYVHCTQIYVCCTRNIFAHFLLNVEFLFWNHIQKVKCFNSIFRCRATPKTLLSVFLFVRLHKCLLWSYLPVLKYLWPITIREMNIKILQNRIKSSKISSTPALLPYYVIDLQPFILFVHLKPNWQFSHILLSFLWCLYLFNLMKVI